MNIYTKTLFAFCFAIPYNALSMHKNDMLNLEIKTLESENNSSIYEYYTNNQPQFSLTYNEDESQVILKYETANKQPVKIQLIHRNNTCDQRNFEQMPFFKPFDERDLSQQNFTFKPLKTPRLYSDIGTHSEYGVNNTTYYDYNNRNRRIYSRATYTNSNSTKEKYLNPAFFDQPEFQGKENILVNTGYSNKDYGIMFERSTNEYGSIIEIYYTNDFDVITFYNSSRFPLFQLTINNHDYSAHLTTYDLNYHLFSTCYTVESVIGTPNDIDNYKFNQKRRQVDLANNVHNKKMKTSAN